MGKHYDGVCLGCNSDDSSMPVECNSTPFSGVVAFFEQNKINYYDSNSIDAFLACTSGAKERACIVNA